MSRCQVKRTLPPLASLLPRFNGFGPAENKTQALYDQVQALAVRLHGPASQPFYSVREVAAFFGVTAPSVTRVYERLEAAGLLLRLRGAMTLLRGTRPQPRSPVQGVVALPIWSYGYLALVEWQVFFQQLAESLRQHYLVADYIFYSYKEYSRPDFAEMLLAHHPDYLVWLFPLADMFNQIQATVQRGVQALAVAMPPTHTPFPTYVVSWERALSKVLRDQADRGATEVVIPLQPGGESPMAGVVRRLATRHNLTCSLYQIADLDSPDWVGYVRALTPRRNRVVVFADDLWCDSLCRAAWGEMLPLLSQPHVVFLHRPTVQARWLTSATINILALDWRKLAERIATDIATEKLFQPVTQATFHARWRPAAPAEKFGQEV